MTNDDQAGAATIDGGWSPPDGASLPPPVARHRIWRSTDRILSGAAAGLASALGVDAAWTRLAFVVLTLFRGVGVWAYGLAVCLLPAGPFAGPPSRRRQLGAVVCGTAIALVLWDGLESPYANRLAFPSGPLGLIGSPTGLVLVLAGAAVVLWRRDRPTQVPARAPLSASSPRSGSGVEPRLAATACDAGTGTVATAEVAPAPQRVPRVRRQPSNVGRLALATAIAALAGSVIAGARPGGLRIAAGVATIVCGVGLVATAFGRRARYLVIPAIIAAVTGVVASATAWAGTSFGVFGSGGYYGSLAATDTGTFTIPARIDERAGDVQLVLGHPPFPDRISVHVGRGDVNVLVPRNGSVRAEITATLGIGRVTIEGERRLSGWHHYGLHRVGPESATTVVHLDLAVGIGRISVTTYDETRYSGPFITVPFPAVNDPATDPAVGPDAAGVYPDGRVVEPDGTVRYPDGSVVTATGSIVLTDGTVVESDGTITPGVGAGVRVARDGTAITSTGALILPDGSVALPEGPRGQFVIPSQRTAARETTTLPGAEPATTFPSSTIAGPSAQPATTTIVATTSPTGA